MNPFKKKKTPSELVKSTVNSLVGLSAPIAALQADKKADDKLLKKLLDKISRHLTSMVGIIQADPATEPRATALLGELTEEILGSTLLLQLITNLKWIEFESRKEVFQIVHYLVRNKKDDAKAHIVAEPSIVKLLVTGYDDVEIALNCGAILREVIRIEDVCGILLNDEKLFDSFFDLVQKEAFDIAADAFLSFKLMLTKHKICPQFLEKNFDRVFKKYKVLLESRNYVTKRQSLKLLGELLLERANFKIMIKYINSADYLKTLMTLLRGNTKYIQTEAFHVFKIFVANPRKSGQVLEILVRNKDKLIDYLTKFQTDKEDQEFNDQKAQCIASLSQLDASMLEQEKPAGASK